MYMAVQILKNGGQADVLVMQDFIHGFCNMDVKGFGVNEYRRGTELTTSLFRQIFLAVDQKRYMQMQKSALLPEQQIDEDFDVVENQEDNEAKLLPGPGN